MPAGAHDAAAGAGAARNAAGDAGPSGRGAEPPGGRDALLALAAAPDSAFASSLAAYAHAPPQPPPLDDTLSAAGSGSGSVEAPAGGVSAEALAGADVERGLRCRVCLSGTEDGPMTQLHCACRGELAIIHEACAKRWFQRRRSGVCEVCRTQAFDLPPADLVVHLTDAQAAGLARREAHPRLRKAVLLVMLAATLGLILAGALGWMVPSLHCRHANLPAGVLPVAFFISVFNHRIFMLVPYSIRESWHALGLLASVCLLVDVSILMTGSDAWC